MGEQVDKIDIPRKLEKLIAAVEQHLSDGKHVGPRSQLLRDALEEAKKQ